MSRPAAASCLIVSRSLIVRHVAAPPIHANNGEIATNTKITSKHKRLTRLISILRPHCRRAIPQTIRRSRHKRTNPLNARFGRPHFVRKDSRPAREISHSQNLKPQLPYEFLTSDATSITGFGNCLIVRTNIATMLPSNCAFAHRSSSFNASSAARAFL